MIPDQPKPNTSKAERRLFNRLRSELPDDCYVLHSLGLADHETKRWGEADFVILSPRGIFVIEVKGGGVNCENGVWIFTNRRGESNQKTEGPFEQAKKGMFEVEKLLRDAGLRNMLIGFGVIISDDTFTTVGAEILPEVLLDRRNIHKPLIGYLQDLAAYWSSRTNRSGFMPAYPEKGDLEKARQILRPDIRTALTLNSSLSRIEQEQVELIEEQCRILERMNANPRTVVKGSAGTGKTLLALDTAVRRAEKGQRTLYLCYNRLLGKHVREHVQANFSDLPLVATSIHSWFRHIIGKAGLSEILTQKSEADDDFYSEHFPTVYQEALIELADEGFDCLIIDEAQDLISGPNLDALDLTLKNSLSDGNWHVFLDPLQTIYNGFDYSLVERLRSYGFSEYELTVNCRNTMAVAVTASTISGLNIPLEDAVEGGMTDVRFITRDGNQHKALEKALGKFIKDGVGRDDIIILTKHPLNKSSLADVERLADLRIRDLNEDSSRGGKGIDFCTMHAFKGLERKVVLAWDLDDLDDENNRLLHYCGLTRARSCLIAFVNDQERSAYERLALDFGKRQP